MGKLIVIEGTDGSGKSTQFKRLSELGKRLNDDRVKGTKVSVEESPGSRASYFE